MSTPYHISGPAIYITAANYSLDDAASIITFLLNLNSVCCSLYSRGSMCPYVLFHPFQMLPRDVMACSWSITKLCVRPFSVQHQRDGKGRAAR